MKKIFTAEEINKQREADEISLKEEWRALAEEAGGGERGEQITSAFKQLYTLYTTELAEWYAGLYDPTVGGYYATESGRDTEGFAPDLEATMQSLRFIEQSGMIRSIGSLRDALPEDMQTALFKFAKRLQNPNGYFYHPQWTFEDVHYNLSRRGRDLGWAVQLLTVMGGAPTYDTPNGKQGDGLDADGNPVTNLSGSGAGEADGTRNTQRTEVEAPKLQKYPEYLESKETFLKYLGEMNINDRSYHWGNQFNATSGQIRARSRALEEEGAGYSLCDILINWLNEHIIPETGYWGRQVNMEGTNGFFKIIPLYNTWGYPYPYPEKATESVLAGIMGDEIDENNCCSIFNLWSGISFIKKNVMLNPDESLRDKVLFTINETMRDKGAEAILNTYRKVIPYQKAHGAFSHQYNSCGGTQQGLYTGLTPMYGVLEGCVDGSGICSTGLTRSMFEAFGFKRVSLLTRADWMCYLNVINSYKKRKKRVQNPLVSFKEGTIPKTVNPIGSTQLNLREALLIVPMNEMGDGLLINPTARITHGKFFCFEADIAFCDMSEGTAVTIGSRIGGRDVRYSSLMTLTSHKDVLTLDASRWQVGFSSVIGKAGERIKLRIEYSLEEHKRLDEAKKKCTVADVYVNGKFVGKSVNNDGTDPHFPSPSSLNVMHAVQLELKSGSAKLVIDSVRFSYSDN